MSCYIIGDRDYGKFPLTEMEKRLKDAREYLGRENLEQDDLSAQASFSLAGECRKCHMPIVATCSALRKDAMQLYGCIASSKKTMPFIGVVEAVYPAPTPPYSHTSLPDKVQESFIALQKMLMEKKPAHLIIMGCRIVLEASVRELGGGKDGDTLHRRIISLFEQGIITASLRDWANVIKNFGNGAAHKMLGTEEEARELVDFTKIFLQFTFELPATIKAMQSQ